MDAVPVEREVSADGVAALDIGTGNVYITGARVSTIGGECGEEVVPGFAGENRDDAFLVDLYSVLPLRSVFANEANDIEIVGGCGVDVVAEIGSKTAGGGYSGGYYHGGDEKEVGGCLGGEGDGELEVEVEKT